MVCCPDVSADDNGDARIRVAGPTQIIDGVALPKKLARFHSLLCGGRAQLFCPRSGLAPGRAIRETISVGSSLASYIASADAAFNLVCPVVVGCRGAIDCGALDHRKL